MFHGFSGSRKQENTWIWYICFPVKEAGKRCYRSFGRIVVLQTMKAGLIATQYLDNIAENIIMIGILLHNW